MKATAKAHVNIALIKYWGKKDELWNLPLTSSISFTLDKFYTITTVEYQKYLNEDELYIDNQLIIGKEYDRVVNFMKRIRKMYHIPYKAIIKSENFVPKKAGLASSSSAFSALSLAATKAFGIKLNYSELSSLSRLGSGSAARSVYGGLVYWDEGNNHDTSFAKPINGLEDLAILVCLVDEGEKILDSRSAMNKLKEYDDLKNDWIDKTNIAINNFMDALNNDDFIGLGLIAEEHALLMHNYIEKTGINYLNNSSHKIINLTRELREKGFEVFATMDAGANVKIITKQDVVKDVLPYYEKITKVVVCGKGEGIKII